MPPDRCTAARGRSLFGFNPRVGRCPASLQRPTSPPSHPKHASQNARPLRVQPLLARVLRSLIPDAFASLLRQESSQACSSDSDKRGPRQAAFPDSENCCGAGRCSLKYSDYFYKQISNFQNPLRFLRSPAGSLQQQQQQHRPNRAKKMRLRRIGLRPSGLRPKLVLASPFVGPMLPRRLCSLPPQ